MTAARDINALTFDVFGTVVDWRTSVAREAAAFGAKHGIELDWEQFADDWRALYQPAMSKVRDGDMGFVRLDVLHRMNLDELFERHGIREIPETEIDALNRAWHRLDPWPDAVAGLARLRTKFILATLSNGNVALMVNMAKRAGLPWDVILGAETARAYKPQPQAYLSAADWLGLAPHQCMMVAAHNDDLAAAGALGFRTAFVARPTEYGPHQSRDFEAEDEWDYIARDFEDLASQLDC